MRLCEFQRAMRERFCEGSKREKHARISVSFSLFLRGRTRAERSWKRLDALHPLLSDILTNSGAPRADNYFCGPRGPRLPLASSFTAGPPSCVARLSARSPFSSPSLFSSPSYTGMAIFRAESHRPFAPFFLRGPEGPGRKRVRGRGETLRRFKSSRDTHESTSHLRTLRTPPTPPFRVILRSISGLPLVKSLNDQHAPMILIFHLYYLAQLGFIYLCLCLCTRIYQRSIGWVRLSSMDPIRKWNRFSYWAQKDVAKYRRPNNAIASAWYISIELILMLYEKRCMTLRMLHCIFYWYFAE